jgi:hypothetical protein
MLRDDRLKLRDKCSVPRKVEVRFNALFDGVEPKLIEPVSLITQT